MAASLFQMIWFSTKVNHSSNSKFLLLSKTTRFPLRGAHFWKCFVRLGWWCGRFEFKITLRNVKNSKHYSGWVCPRQKSCLAIYFCMNNLEEGERCLTCEKILFKHEMNLSLGSKVIPRDVWSFWGSKAFYREWRIKGRIAFSLGGKIILMPPYFYEEHFLATSLFLFSSNVEPKNRHFEPLFAFHKVSMIMNAWRLDGRIMMPFLILGIQF